MPENAATLDRPTTPIIDLHCDLLAYLWIGEQRGEKRSPRDDRSRVSIPQMRRGGVKIQTLAIFALPQAGSARAGEQQSEIFARLLERFPDDLRPVVAADDLERDDRVGVIAALEGGSTFAEEDEPLTAALDRLDAFEKRLGKIFYLSLTWNHETRFGGGNATRVGLKDDGRVLLEYLSGRRIAVDLSHASHPLAADILDVIYASGLDIPVLASHSNFAAIRDLPRNLPEEIAREIIARDGVIGLNFLVRFLGQPPPQGFADQVAHALALGAARNYAFGADFFYEKDVPAHLRKSTDEEYAADYGDAACYPRLLDDLAERLELRDEVIEDLAWRNAERFLKRLF